VRRSSLAARSVASSAAATSPPRAWRPGLQLDLAVGLAVAGNAVEERGRIGGGEVDAQRSVGSELAKQPVGSPGAKGGEPEPGVEHRLAPEQVTTLDRELEVRLGCGAGRDALDRTYVRAITAP
jgi:hypothetical protein